MTLALLAAAAALLLWPGRTDQAPDRIAALLDRLPERRDTIGPLTRHRREVGAAAAGAVVLLFVGGAGGVIGGAVAAAVAHRVLGRLETAADRGVRAARAAALPDVLDLLAAALVAGLPPPTALATVAEASAGPLSADLAQVGQLYLLGAGPAAAWAELSADPVLGRVAVAAARSAESGTALAAALNRLADDLRTERALHLETAARRLSVLVLAPLTLCFLPAFLCVGVAPILLGLASQFLH